MRLEEEVIALRKSDAWAAYLAAQARFHRYSPRNVMLISLQRPEATNVAGYTTWAALGRQVRRGERAISILAPLLRRAAPDQDAQLTGFRWVNVFDLAQTDGEPLPSPVSLLRGDAPQSLVDDLIGVANEIGFSVAPCHLPEGVNGECRWASSTIAVEKRNDILQQAKTLAHELGHALLHRNEADRARAEIEAEAVAFIVLAAQGADSTPYSAGYLASWVGPEGDVATSIASSCAAIQRAAAHILSLLECQQGRRC